MAKKQYESLFLSVVCLIVFVSIEAANCSDAANTENVGGDGLSRREQLMRHLQCNDSLVLRRIILELSVSEKLNKREWIEVFQAVSPTLFEEVKFEEQWQNHLRTVFPPVIDVLANCQAEVIPEICRLIRSNATKNGTRRLLLAVLGRVGQPAEAAVPELTKLLDDPQTLPSITRVTRVVLASIGWKSNDNLPAVRAALDEACDEVAWTIAATRSVNWLTDGMIDALVDHVMFNRDIIATAVGLVGERASSPKAETKLENARQRCIALQMAGQITNALALARIAPKRRKAILLDVCKNFNFKETSIESWVLVAHACPFILINTDMANHLVALAVDETSGEACERALTLLYLSGISGPMPKSITYPIIRAVQGNGNETKQVKMAVVLSQIAAFSTVNDLEAAAAVSKEGNVKEELSTVVRFIRDLKVDDEHLAVIP
jgi:hypothetical protein